MMALPSLYHFSVASDAVAAVEDMSAPDVAAELISAIIEARVAVAFNHIWIAR